MAKITFSFSCYSADSASNDKSRLFSTDFRFHLIILPTEKKNLPSPPFFFVAIFVEMTKKRKFNAKKKLGSDRVDLDVDKKREFMKR